MKNIAIICFAVIMLIAGYFYSINYKIYFNLSPSFDAKILLVNKKIDKNSLNYGNLVVFKNRFLTKYTPKRNILAKQISCKENDELIRINNNFYCNGKQIATAKDFDSNNEKMDIYYPTNKIIAKDKLFVTSNHKNSYDSRYFGLIDKNEIIGAAIWQK